MRTNSHRRASKGFVAFGLILSLVLFACTLSLRPVSSAPTVDSSATTETKALFLKLYLLSGSNQTLFGHQDDTFFGVGWTGDADRSDVRETSGSYPAVYGWELGALELGGPNNVDGVPFSRIHDEIIAGYRRGGVITVSWHMFNPVTFQSYDPDNCTPQPGCRQNGTFYDTTEAVSEILPGGSLHAQYMSWLDDFAAFDNTLTVSSVPWDTSPHQVPIILRLFHEHNGSVFWWGGHNTTAADYVSLWQFTVHYLRDVKGLHNLLYAYSPDARFMRTRSSDGTFADLASFQGDYYYAYPGDAYVDVFGLDDYTDVEGNRLDVFQGTLNFLLQTAHGRSDIKIPALTEIGNQRWLTAPASWTDYPDWWTKFLYSGLISTRRSRGQVAYVLTWRNSSASDRAGPYPDGADAADFVDFKNKRPIILGDEIAPLNLYTWP